MCRMKQFNNHVTYDQPPPRVFSTLKTHLIEKKLQKVWQLQKGQTQHHNILETKYPYNNYNVRKTLSAASIVC